MRYCIHCGNPLNPGASFCHTCGAALKAVVPEADEAPVAAPIVEEIPQAEPVEVCAAEPVAEEPVAEEPVVVEEPAANEPVVLSAAYDKDIRDEKKFLDDTHKFLRWERKAWSISGKVFLIVGIVLTALYFLIGIVFLATGEDVAAAGGVFLYGSLIFAMFIVIGIVNIKAADKIDQYTDTLYKDFSLANNRCNSIGMIVFCYFFNEIALVFFVINFVRMKCNKAMRERILKRQGVQ